MKEINIKKIITSKRREKGITQDELATYIGVSKASVSKWETGQSYPDITFLPQLATYFNISIDELMGYAPQMTKKDIKKLYGRLSEDFVTKEFSDVIKECDEIIKKYYSCFPLLLQIAVLLVNHTTLIKEVKDQQEMLNKVCELCKRVKTESEDVLLVKDAVLMEASCYLFLNQPQEVLELLGEEIRPITNDIGMQAQAYQLMGNVEKAKETIQIDMYQHLITLIGESTQYLLLNEGEEERTDEIIKRTLAVIKNFNLEKLHTNIVLQVYLCTAQIYANNEKYEKSLEMLSRFMELCISRSKEFKLQGDDYFDKIEGWFDTFELGGSAPRSTKLIKESMLNAILLNQAFEKLKDFPEYKKIVNKLMKNI